MKNKKAIFIAGMLVVLGATKLVSASGDNIIEPVDLSSGYYQLSDDELSEVLEDKATENVVTTIIETTTTMPVKVFTVEELRYLYGKCGEFHDLALEVGWTEKEWPKLSHIIWRESRCTIDAWNGYDAGLTQINQIHSAWLLQMGYDHPDDMFNARNNLYFAYRLWSGREENGQCGWKPWSMNCN
jgi:hypothetical protein